MIKQIKKIADHVLALFYPPKCVFCGSETERGGLLVCHDCPKTLPFTHDNGCFEGIGGISYVIAPFEYKFPVDRAIRGVKFQYHRAYADTLTHYLCAYLRRIPDMAWMDIVVPVPLGRDRLRRRDFNQAELIARRIAGELGLGLDTDILLRIRETAQQSSLSKHDRVLNVRGAFASMQALEGMRVLLVDDVYTTGQTAANCAAALKAAGAEKVVLAVLANAHKQSQNYRKNSIISPVWE